MALYYSAKRAANEAERLQALAEYRVLGTKPEQCYDDITRIASITCGTPIALMSLVSDEKQWFKSTVGLEARETPRNRAGPATPAHRHEQRPIRYIM